MLYQDRENRAIVTTLRLLKNDNLNLDTSFFVWICFAVDAAVIKTFRLSCLVWILGSTKLATYKNRFYNYPNTFHTQLFPIISHCIFKQLLNGPFKTISAKDISSYYLIFLINYLIKCFLIFVYPPTIFVFTICLISSIL